MKSFIDNITLTTKLKQNNEGWFKLFSDNGHENHMYNIVCVHYADIKYIHKYTSIIRP